MSRDLLADPAFVCQLVDLSFRKARERFRVEPNQPGACVYLAMGALMAGRELGLPMALQAGSAGWLRLSFDRQDEDNAEFSYRWDAQSPLTRMMIAGGMLPEIHCWVADPLSERIFDAAVLGLPMTCRLNTGLAWEAPIPSYQDCVITRDVLDAKRWRYEPDIEAMDYIALRLRRDGIRFGG